MESQGRETYDKKQCGLRETGEKSGNPGQPPTLALPHQSGSPSSPPSLCI